MVSHFETFNNVYLQVFLIIPLLSFNNPEFSLVSSITKGSVPVSFVTIITILGQHFSEYGHFV